MASFLRLYLCLIALLGVSVAGTKTCQVDDSFFIDFKPILKPQTFHGSGWQIQADQVTTNPKTKLMQIDGRVILRKKKQLIWASQLTTHQLKPTTLKRFCVKQAHWQDANMLFKADQLCVINDHHLTASGIHYRLNRPDQQGYFWGKAKTLTGTNDVWTLHQASMSTCNTHHPTWKILAKSIQIQLKSNQLVIKHLRWQLKERTLLFWPQYRLSLHKDSEQMIQLPSFFYSSSTGFGVKWPVNFMLKKGQLLVNNKYTTKRRFGMDILWRQDLTNLLQLAFQFNDRLFLKQQADRTEKINKIDDPYVRSQLLRGQAFRYGWWLTTNKQLNDHWSIHIQGGKTSDSAFYDDFSERIHRLDYHHEGYHVMLKGQYLQSQWVLQWLDPKTLFSINEPDFPIAYQQTPNLYGEKFWQLSDHWQANLTGQWVNFVRKTSEQAPNAQRLHTEAGLAWSSIAPWGSIWLKADAVFHRVASDPNQIHQFTLPRVQGWWQGNSHQIKVKNGLINAYPKLFYGYAPYRDQSQIGNYNTQYLPYMSHQFWSIERFMGGDRVSDANEATVGYIIDWQQRQTKIHLAVSQKVGAYHRVGLNNADQIDPMFDHHIGPIALSFNWVKSGRPLLNLKVAKSWQWKNWIQAVISGQIHHQHHIWSWDYQIWRAKTQDIKPDFNQFRLKTFHSLSEKWGLDMGLTYQFQEPKPLGYELAAVYQDCCFKLRFGMMRTYSAGASQTSSPYSNQFKLTLELTGIDRFQF
jgi:hypothetical protein